MFRNLRNEVFGLKGETVALRRDFHKYPELGMEEERTAGIVAEKLADLSLEVTTRVGKTGVIGVLRSSRPGKTLLLRAEMDALPIKEENKVSYRSKTNGIMHACGHDGHMACLLTVAKVLCSHRNDFSGQIKFVFQPGEESFGGARLMIEDGVLDGLSVDGAFALHLSTTLPVGTISTRSGPMMACMDSFTLKVRGKGAHAAKPDEGADAILMSAQLISTMQSLSSREFSPQTPVVAHIGMIHGGSAFNAVADEVELKGTMRIYDDVLRKSLPERMNRMARGVTSALRGKYHLDYEFGYPALVNDSAMTELAMEVAAQVVGKERVVECQKFLSSEDMAFFLKRVPGCFFFVGAGNKKKGLWGAQHSSRFDFDEDALSVGAEIMARLALTYLGPQSNLIKKKTSRPTKATRHEDFSTEGGAH